ncbi:MAG: bifunctional glutamate N-acetyltransferase/amino-acid acetyltransferase ArgJ [Chloroflexi bacterium]|nr:bifunctional glutamate N-acetyltransferase/amino-acid acetyltransferase ArgJ [Chloroflexota bacterium]MBV9894875.1 bifunctional glutamate N-acetyltransferase/amino-acid acetyltransferase ArgJ [Chloroflexota bacterium]
MTATSELFVVLQDGSSTSARGFKAGALAAGIKPSGRPDLGIWASEVPCVAVATFTQNTFPAAPVMLSRERLQLAPRAQAVVFNAGNANACNGDRGLRDAREMAELAAARMGIAAELVLVAETGIIGEPLPMDRVRAGLARVELNADGGRAAAEAIMTTDTRRKDCAVSVEVGGKEVRIGAMTKGVGMIYPNMATMLAFVGTDAALEPAFARSALKAVVDKTFNMITVDGDTSTNDSCFLLANGLSGAPELTADHADANRFVAGLEAVCIDLARRMAADGEGAEKLLQVDVTGAASDDDARKAARAVVGSPLVKSALHGQDPNWGRIFAAVGYSGARVDPMRAALWIGSVQIARDGVATGASKADASAEMRGDEVTFHVDLGLGTGTARAWGCDLTEGYVVENSAYST